MGNDLAWVYLLLFSGTEKGTIMIFKTQLMATATACSLLLSAGSVFAGDDCSAKIPELQAQQAAFVESLKQVPAKYTSTNETPNRLYEQLMLENIQMLVSIKRTEVRCAIILKTVHSDGLEECENTLGELHIGQKTLEKNLVNVPQTVIDTKETPNRLHEQLMLEQIKLGTEIEVLKKHCKSEHQ